MAQTEKIGVVVAGAAGRMGCEVVRAILAQPDMALMGATDVARVGEDAGLVADVAPCGVTIASQVHEALDPSTSQVLVDFTRAGCAVENVLSAVTAGVACVVGTTGLDADQLERIARAAGDYGVGVLVAPNFALGAVLMMRFASEAARYYEWAEIIERHHEKKIDAPSGTALRTAELMAAERRAVGGSFQQVAGEVEKLASARGGEFQGIRIHSVRSPGHLAHQEVVLGGLGETLTIRHDSTARTSFMPGVMLAIRRIPDAHGLLVGLEHLLTPP